MHPGQVAVTVEPEAPAGGTSTSAGTLTFTSLYSSQSGTAYHGKLVTLTATASSISANPVAGTVDSILYYRGTKKTSRLRPRAGGPFREQDTASLPSTVENQNTSCTPSPLSSIVSCSRFYFLHTNTRLNATYFQNLFRMYILKFLPNMTS